MLLVKIGNFRLACLFNLQLSEKLDKKLTYILGAMGVVQLAKWLLPTSEVSGSNLVIGKVFVEDCLLSTVLKRRK